LGILNNFLTSGHEFSENDGLRKFRFGILNCFLLLPSITNILHFLAPFFELADFDVFFLVAVTLYFTFNMVLILLLRKDKKYYIHAVTLFVGSSILLFYTVLFTRLDDEFRLIGFFAAMFMTYVLLGKWAGIILSLLLATSIFFISKSIDLEISSVAYSSFFTFFMVISGLLYLFLDKIEKDSLEFEVLHARLQEKVRQETSQRLEQEKMLLRRSRMANLGEMLDSIAHQWRQPLMHINSILLNMENSVDNDDIKEEEQKYLRNKIDEVASLTMHMSQTIEDFRGLFKVEKEYTEFYLRDVVDDVLALLKNNLNDIDVEINSENDTSVLGHRSELMQVIIILLSNSIDILKTRDVSNKTIIINIEALDKNVSISVEDNGGGINQCDTDSVFDPYFTTKEQFGGTGLGLYIARIIVEHNMDGDITASNTFGGAKFLISLAREPSMQQSSIT